MIRRFPNRIDIRLNPNSSTRVYVSYFCNSSEYLNRLVSTSLHFGLKFHVLKKDIPYVSPPVDYYAAEIGNCAICVICTNSSFDPRCLFRPFFAERLEPYPCPIL